MLQWLKKIVPEPRVPEIGGSSPSCTETAATRASRPAPQNPRSPASRFTPHSRGHRRQDERRSFAGWAGANPPRHRPRMGSLFEIYGKEESLQGAGALEEHSLRLSVLRLEECPSPITHKLKLRAFFP